MNVDITSALTNFFSIFQTVYDWLDNHTFTVGSVTFSFIQLAISIIIIDLIIWFVFNLLGGD